MNARRPGGDGVSERVSRTTIYESLGEDGVRALVKAFYDVIEQEPDARALHLLHLRGSGMSHARTQQFEFLSGFLGGPRLYVERQGHSHLREIHAHVPIDAEMRDLWLRCMSRALDQTEVPADLRETLMRHFTRAAEMVRNLPADPAV